MKALTLLFQQCILLWQLVKSACAAMCAKLAKIGKFVTPSSTCSKTNQGMAQHLSNGSAQRCERLPGTVRENCIKIASFTSCQPALKTRRHSTPGQRTCVFACSGPQNRKNAVTMQEHVKF